jgi:hypothetical protein
LTFFGASTKTRSGLDGVCRDCRGAPAKIHPLKLKAMCTGKRRYKTRVAAFNTAIKHALKHKGAPVKPYECPACAGWHLTTHPKGRKKK